MPFHPRRNIKLEVEQLSRRAKRVEAMRPRISLAEHIAKFVRTVRRFGWALQFVGIRTEQLRPPPEANSQSYDRTAHYAEHEQAAAALFKAQRCESLRRWVVRYRGLALTSHLKESGHDPLPMLELLHFVEPRYVSVEKFFDRWDSVKPWLESLALEVRKKPGDTMEWLTKAILAIRKRPDWSITQVAKHVHKATSTLTRNKIFMQAWATHIPTTAKGHILVNERGRRAGVDAVSDSDSPLDKLIEAEENEATLRATSTHRKHRKT